MPQVFIESRTPLASGSVIADAPKGELASDQSLKVCGQRITP